MPKCNICKKNAKKGRMVSHSNKKSIRRFTPNLVLDKADGLICTSCLKRKYLLR